MLVTAAGAALYFGLIASANTGGPGSITAEVNSGGAQSGLNTTSVVNGSTANTIQFVFTASPVTTDTEFTVVVPSGWSTPQTSSSGTAGYVSLGACPSGSAAITGGQTIDVTFSTPLPSSSTCTVTYGAGGNGGAPSTNVGTQTWTSAANTGTGLTSVSIQPQINVLSADGSGTMQISPTSTKAASSGNTYTLTYFAGTGGLSNGSLRVVVPAGFSAPSTTSSDPGYTTTDCTGGPVSVSGQAITVSGISFTAGACSITYGAKTGGGPGATAGTAYGAASFSSEEQSGNGSLTSLSSSPSVFVTPDHFAVTDSLGGGHASAGTAFDVTVTAKDASGATMTGYTGQVDFSTSDGSVSAQVPGSYTFTGGDNGTHTFSSGVTLVTAGAKTVTATDHTYNAVTGTDNVTVDPGSATHYALNGTTTVTAGTLDQLTLSARDQYGNIATSYSGSKSITFSGAAASANATQPYIYDAAGAEQSVGGAISVTFSGGIATGGLGGADANELKIFLPAAAENDINATDGATLNSNTLAITVTPAEATHFGVSGPANWNAGYTNNVGVYALDPYGNVDTSYDSGSGCTALTWSGASASPGGTAPQAGGCANNGSSEVSFGQTSYAEFSSGVASVPVTLYDATWPQTADLAVTDGTLSTPSTFDTTVYPAAPQDFVIGGSATQTAGTSQSITITAADKWGNPDPNYDSTIPLTFSGADNSPNGTQPTITNSSGSAINAFSGNTVSVAFSNGVASPGAGATGQLHMTLFDAEAADVSVTDGTLSGDLNVAVADAGVKHFDVYGSSSQGAGTSQLISIAAVDAYDNYATSFDGFESKEITISGADNSPSGATPYFTGNPGQGSVHIPFGSCSDPGSASGITFSDGIGYTNITLYKAETADIRVSDCQSSADTSDGDRPIGVTPAAAAKFAVTSVPNHVSQNGTFSVTTSALDTYGNVTTTSADENYTLSPTDGSGTLGGTTTGTILSGNSSDTVSGVTYDTQETIHLQASGDLTTSAASAPIVVDSPDGSGTMVPLTSHVVPGSTGNELSFEYSPATTMDNGSVSLVVPADWPAPSTNGSDPGYTTAGCSSCSHAGDVAVSGQTITVTNIQTNQPIFIQYGAGSGATAPATSGGETWTASSQEDAASGGLQALASSPTVYVDSPDGSGTLDVSPGSVIAGSTGNDVTLTYTAGTGGLGGGTITIAKPAGWTAFSAASTDTSDCSSCTVSYPSGNLELDNVTLASGEQLTIDYTADAPQVAGDTSFATQEASSSGGTPSDLAAAQTVHVYPAPLDHYGIAGNTTQTAGAEQGLIVVAQDQYGNTESAGPNDVTGDVSLTFSGADTAPDGTDAPTVSDKNGDAVAFGDPTLVTFTDGEAEGDGTQLALRLYDAEAASIGVTDGTASSLAGFGITVSPASLAGFGVEADGGGAIGTQTSGVSFPIQATALDAYGNTVTSYAGPVDFSTNDAACDSGCSSSVSGFSNGVLTHTFALDRSGPGVTVSVADHADGSKTGTSDGFLVVPYDLHVALSGGGTYEAGNSEDVTVTAQDHDGTTATSYTGTVGFSTSDSGDSTTLPSDYTFTGGDNGVHTFSSGVTLTKAGDQTVTATDTSVAALTGTADQTIVPADPSHVRFTSNANDVAEGATKALTAELLDPYDNLVDSNATVDFGQTSGAGSVTGLGSVAAVHGVATDVVTGALAGPVTVTASSGVLATDTTTFNVLPGTPAKLAFTSSTGDLASGTTRTVTAQVEDADGNLVPTASNHVTIAQVSGDGTVKLGSQSSGGGISSRPATGKLAGSVTIEASADGLTPATTTFTVVPGTAAKLVFTSSTANLTAGEARGVTVAVEDASGNVVTADGGHSVKFERVAGPGTVSGLGTTTSSSGVASLSITGVETGSITIKASASGLAVDTTQFKIVQGAPAKLVFTSSPGSLRIGRTRKLAVEVEDALGNKVKSPSISVTFAECSGAGSALGLPQMVTSASGKASTTITGTGIGSITICATADGVSTGTQTLKIVS